MRRGTIADHKVPLAKGGTSDRSNYQLLCKLCSDAKTIIDRGAKAKPATGADGLPLDPDDRWRIAADGGCPSPKRGEAPISRSGASLRTDALLFFKRKKDAKCR